MSTVRLWREAAGLDPRALQPGRDLVLDLGFGHGARLPPGTAVDDLLVAEDRPAVDAEARADLAAWRGRIGDALVVDGLDLAWAWEVELLAECFQPAALLRRALANADPISRVSAPDVRPEAAAWVRACTGAAIDAGHAAGRSEPYRGGPATRVRALASSAVHTLGVPAWPRGDVLCVNYWHLDPVYARLARHGAPVRPVPAGTVLAGVSGRGAVRAAARGGWLGAPGARARATSEHDLRRALAAARGAIVAEDPLRPLHDWALALLEDRAGATLARLRQARRAFTRGRLRLLVVPWDSPEHARVLIAAARAAGVETLLVQHGFDAGLNDPDKSVAEHVASWSQQDAARLRASTSASVTVTGNPGSEHLASSAQAGTRAPAASGRTLVLVEYPSRLSARVEARVGAHHVAVALRALATARPGTIAVVRPHPVDPAPGAYAAAVGEIAGLRVEVDATTPIEPLLDTVDACVGALSTATLQAAARSVPTTVLDVTAAARHWPFDGSADGLPRATREAELAELIAARTPAVRGVALEALGATPGATDRVVALVADLAGSRVGSPR